MSGFLETRPSNRACAQSAKVQIGIGLRRHKMAKNPVSTKSAKKTRLPLSQTEVEAYGFIREQLRDLGWSVKNPSLSTEGHVWTQNQCLSEEQFKLALGAKRPENIVKLSESTVWIIEAKASIRQIEEAVDEAVNYYARQINAACPPSGLRAVLASGVAGNDQTGYIVRTKVLLRGRWHSVTINRQEATGLLSPDDARRLIASNSADIHEFAPPQWLFLQAAERINEILHLGGINKNDRAKTMAALLLSVVEEPPNLDTSLPVLIGEINARSEQVLKDNGKPDFAPFVKLLPPTNKTNHVKFRKALVKTIQELQNLNIRSAMNSSTDVLGQFYEVFLKYGNGAKEIGIVLTPRHVTRFAVEAVGISSKDVVLDPACGTGGFLVAAFDYVRRTATRPQVDRFKQHNLFGIEQESYVAVLAIVNMIFRGDGKHNITEGNSFTTYLTAATQEGHPSARFSKQPPKPGNEPITRVLMNPPFALAASDEKEYRFVSHALSLMADGGLLFSLLPLDSMFGSKDERVWRKDVLLPHHTLLAVISLPSELFYPAAMKQVVGVIIRKGFPHPKDQPVFWGRINRDGNLKVKTRRMAASDLRPPRQEVDEIPSVLPHLQAFLANPRAGKVNLPMLCKTEPIDFEDPLLELLPEAYLEGPAPTAAEIEHAVDEMARQTAAFLVRFRSPAELAAKTPRKQGADN